MAWTTRNSALTENESTNNAREVYSIFGAAGWSLNSICAMLGNMYRESQVNPGAWQNYKVNYNLGYGLVQWTPATKYTQWASARELSISSGQAQCSRILWELDNKQQYYATNTYPETFTQFTQSTKDIEYLTRAWFYNYERGNVTYAEMPTRIKWAKYYYELFSGENPTPPEPEQPVFGDRDKRKRILIMLKRRRKLC